MGLIFSNTICYTAAQIASLGGNIIENQDGTVSVFVPAAGRIAPLVLSEECCLALNSGYTFDIDTQSCRWTGDTACSIENMFKIVLNPNGNDGSIFYVGSNDTCSLNVNFDYLFKIDCATLNSFLTNSGTTSQIAQEIVFLETEIEQQTAECEALTNQINILQAQISATPYSIVCITLGPPNFNFSGGTPAPFNNTGFLISATTINFDNNIIHKSEHPLVLGSIPSSFNVQNKTFCLTEPIGLLAWDNILGSNFQAFLSGDTSSYDCNDVLNIYTLNNTELTNNPQATPLLIECNTPPYARPSLELQIQPLLIQQAVCSSLLTTLIAELNLLQASAATENISLCLRPIDMFEQLSASVTIDVVTSANTLQTVFEDDSLFPAIGFGNLYTYLVNNPTSGFYVCGGIGCTPLNLNLTPPIQSNDISCNAILSSLVNDLYLESGLMGQTNGLTAFTSSISNTAFTSNWLHYSMNITGTTILSQIANKKIKLSLKLNHTCGPICIYLDNINLSKDCTRIDETTIFVTKCPGFELDRIRDNKKSWSANTSTVNRTFGITDILGNNLIRETAYDVDDERLVINTKEIDLDMDLASGIETDIWGYLKNNPCLLNGFNHCDPCSYKQFQDTIFFEFQDGQYYDFEDEGFTSGGSQSICCGDYFIEFDKLLTQPLSAITVIEDFEYYISSELIDAKNRQTISAYPTLRALYDRYLNSYEFCGNNSAAFNYMSMDQFATLVGNYWVDIVEQVVPATTIWGSVKIYSNTIFDQQKFKYRAYSTLFCGNPFYNKVILSPIYGISGVCVNVESTLTVINAPILTGMTIIIPPTPIVCDFICIAQMNSGSEFIGTVTTVGGHLPIPINMVNPSIINENPLQLEVIVSGLTAYVIVVGATAPIIYLWSNGDPNSTTTFIGAGQYNVTVTDAYGNTITTDFTIT